MDAESITVAALYTLAQRGAVELAAVSRAIADLGVDPDKVDPTEA